MGKIIVDRVLCKGCGVCVLNCPKDIIVLSDEVNAKGNKWAIQTDEEKCIGCALCGLVCPDSAITVYR